jgi:hypothetical protein
MFDATDRPALEDAAAPEGQVGHAPEKRVAVFHPNALQIKDHWMGDLRVSAMEKGKRACDSRKNRNH